MSDLEVFMDLPNVLFDIVAEYVTYDSAIILEVKYYRGIGITLLIESLEKMRIDVGNRFSLGPYYSIGIKGIKSSPFDILEYYIDGDFITDIVPEGLSKEDLKYFKVGDILSKIRGRGYSWRPRIFKVKGS